MENFLRLVIAFMIAIRTVYGCTPEQVRQKQQCWERVMNSPEMHTFTKSNQEGSTNVISQCSTIYNSSVCGPQALVADKCLNQMELHAASNLAIPISIRRETLLVVNKCLPSFSVDFYRALQALFKPTGATAPVPAPALPNQNLCALNEQQVICVAQLLSAKAPADVQQAASSIWKQKQQCMQSLPASCRFDELRSTICASPKLKFVIARQGQALQQCVKNSG